VCVGVCLGDETARPKGPRLGGVLRVGAVSLLHTS